MNKKTAKFHFSQFFQTKTAIWNVKQGLRLISTSNIISSAEAENGEILPPLIRRQIILTVHVSSSPCLNRKKIWASLKLEHSKTRCYRPFSIEASLLSSTYQQTLINLHFWLYLTFLPEDPNLFRYQPCHLLFYGGLIHVFL